VVVEPTNATGSTDVAVSEPDKASQQLPLSSRAAELGDQAKQIIGAAEGDVAAVATSAARLVQRAGMILEEELSVGIAALDRIENRFVDVDKVRDPETHELLNRFRTDAHQIVDLLLDVVGSSFDAVGKIADDGISIGVPLGRMGAAVNGSPPSVNGASTGKVSVLEVHDPVARGGTAEVSMSVNNSSDTPTESFSLVASDLVSESGQRISAEFVTFDPHDVSIAAGSSERVAIRVRVPDDVGPGRYAGLVQATNLNHVRAVLTITVT
jgi:hypothetical protein